MTGRLASDLHVSKVWIVLWVWVLLVSIWVFYSKAGLGILVTVFVTAIVFAKLTFLALLIRYVQVHILILIIVINIERRGIVQSFATLTHGHTAVVVASTCSIVWHLAQLAVSACSEWIFDLALVLKVAIAIRSIWIVSIEIWGIGCLKLIVLVNVLDCFYFSKWLLLRSRKLSWLRLTQRLIHIIIIYHMFKIIEL